MKKNIAATSTITGTVQNGRHWHAQRQSVQANNIQVAPVIMNNKPKKDGDYFTCLISTQQDGRDRWRCQVQKNPDMPGIWSAATSLELQESQQTNQTGYSTQMSRPYLCIRSRSEDTLTTWTTIPVFIRFCRLDWQRESEAKNSGTKQGKST